MYYISIGYDHEQFCVTIQDFPSRHKFDPLGEYYVEISPNGLTLFSTNDDKKLLTWPFSVLRRYGCSNNSFLFEAGRMCDSGVGTYYLKSKCSKLINQSMKEMSSKATPQNDEPSRPSYSSTDDNSNNEETYNQPVVDAMPDQNAPSNTVSSPSKEHLTMPYSMSVNQTVKNKILKHPNSESNILSQYDKSNNDNHLVKKNNDFLKNLDNNKIDLPFNHKYNVMVKKENEYPYFETQSQTKPSGILKRSLKISPSQSQGDSDMSDDDDNDGDIVKGAQIIRSDPLYDTIGTSNTPLYENTNTDIDETHGYQNLRDLGLLEKRSQTHKYENTRPRCDSEPIDPNSVLPFHQDNPNTDPIDDRKKDIATHLSIDNQPKSSYEIQFIDEPASHSTNREHSRYVNVFNDFDNRTRSDPNPEYAIYINRKNNDNNNNTFDSNRTTRTLELSKTNKTFFHHKPLPPQPLPKHNHSSHHTSEYSKRIPMNSELQVENLSLQCTQSHSANSSPIPIPRMFPSNKTDGYVHNTRIASEEFNRVPEFTHYSGELMQQSPNRFIIPSQVPPHNNLMLYPNEYRLTSNPNIDLDLQDNMKPDTHNYTSTIGYSQSYANNPSSLQSETSRPHSTPHNYLYILPNEIQPIPNQNLVQDNNRLNEQHQNFNTNILPSESSPSYDESVQGVVESQKYVSEKYMRDTNYDRQIFPYNGRPNESLYDEQSHHIQFDEYPPSCSSFDSRTQPYTIVISNSIFTKSEPNSRKASTQFEIEDPQAFHTNFPSLSISKDLI